MQKISDFFKKKSVKITLIVTLSLAVILGGFALYVYPFDNIARGISVDGINIGAMSREDAISAITNDRVMSDEKITITDDAGNTLNISGGDIALCYDYEKTIDEAYNIGRSGNFLDDCITLVKTAFIPCDTGYKYGFDAEKLGGIIYDFGVSQNGEMQEYTVEYEKGYVKVSKGIKGQKKDVSATAETVSEQLTNGVFNVSVKLETEEPPMPTVKSITEFIYKEPLDAQYTIENGVINITDEVLGVSVDEKEVEEKITALSGGETIILKIINTEPEVTRKSLYNQLFSHTLGSHTSKYSASSKNRAANVQLAARLINGLVIAPGETFSYNKAVGPRTAQRGFKEAPVYSNGESVTGIGGGICQVSSTLYSAVLYADLEIVERRNHSMTVDYMPKGQDATVSYGTIDFKFRNNTQNPIKISTSASGGILTVSITGTKPQTEKTVKITNNIVEVINKTTVDIPDETLASGVTKTEEVGKTGYVVDTYKTVFENGVQVKKEYMGRSKYKMVTLKRRVGTKVAETPAPTESTSPAEDVPTFSESEEVSTPTASPSIAPTEEPESTQAPTTNRPEANTEETE